MLYENNQTMHGGSGYDQANTPHFDRLAAMSTLFTGSYTNSTLCIHALTDLANTGRNSLALAFWDKAMLGKDDCKDIPQMEELRHERAHLRLMPQNATTVRTRLRSLAISQRPWRKCRDIGAFSLKRFVPYNLTARR